MKGGVGEDGDDYVSGYVLGETHWYGLRKEVRNILYLISLFTNKTLVTCRCCDPRRRVFFRVNEASRLQIRAYHGRRFVFVPDSMSHCIVTISRRLNWRKKQNVTRNAQSLNYSPDYTWKRQSTKSHAKPTHHQSDHIFHKFHDAHGQSGAKCASLHGKT